MDEEEVQSYIARNGLPPHTATSVVEVREFLKELAAVRKRGFATSREEYIRGVNVVAAPVPAGGAVGALAIAALGLVDSLTTERFEEYGRRVASVARGISLALGGGGRTEGASAGP
ncbi:MAG TPA: IclR family transcriptional regulator C-terminal domain-containing protein, partial [Deferrisomatales bacterium]|nr:IclR family transcriptional regulator C-terminal domain-containing protein [Deferrisomatales bacterium]